MSEPMTEERLAELRQRYAALRSPTPSFIGANVVAIDVRELLGEVDRLNEVDRLRAAAAQPDSAFAIGAARWPGISKLIEECGEVVQVAGKLLATYDDVNHWSGPPLDQRLEEEMGDVLAAIEFVMRHNPQLNTGRILDRRAEKLLWFEDWHAKGDPLPSKESGR